MRLRACAKINLTLEVLGRRPDGYHDIASVFQAISLFDTLTLEEAESLSLRCSLPDLENEGNLALKAALALQQATGCRAGASITLEKGIPVAGGLGGGSSDAAAVLLGLNRLWRLDLASSRLAQVAASVGSDVPYFLLGGTALVEGRGERVTPLPPAPPLWVVLLLAPQSYSGAKTAQLYSLLQKEHYASGDATSRLVAALREGRFPQEALVNSFEAVAYRAFPFLEDHRRAFLRAGAASVHLTGSGPTLYTLVAEEEEARLLASRMEGAGHKVAVARMVGPKGSA